MRAEAQATRTSGLSVAHRRHSRTRPWLQNLQPQRKRAVAMRQVWITRKGGPEVLQVREAPDCAPREGEVRIRVRAAGVNFADVLTRVGLYPDAPPLPCVVGYEVSGVIDAPPRRAGERVIAMPHFGGYSDTVSVPVASGVPLPGKPSFTEGAALPRSCRPALRILAALRN